MATWSMRLNIIFPVIRIVPQSTVLQALYPASLPAGGGADISTTGIRRRERAARGGRRLIQREVVGSLPARDLPLVFGRSTDSLVVAGPTPCAQTGRFQGFAQPAQDSEKGCLQS